MEDKTDLIELPKNDRFRSFMILLYDDTSSYDFDRVMFEIRGFKQFAYIKHLPEEDEKKVHYHLYIHLDSACTISSVSKRLGVPDKFIQNVRSERACLRYLTHIDYPEKNQYHIEDIICSKNLERKIVKAHCDVEDETTIIDNIYKFIVDLKNQYDYHNAVMQLIKFVNINCYDSVYKRYRLEFKEYMNDLYFNHSF